MSRRPPFRILCSVFLLINGAVSVSAASGASNQSAGPAGSGNAGPAAASYTDLGYGQYPRVTEAEQQLLGKTYENEPLTTRVARLETKQFGKPSTKDDLADRLDRLDQFVKRPEPPQDDSDQMPVAGNGGGGGNQGNAVPQSNGSTVPAGAADSSGQPQYSASDYGNYPRVTELEQQFLGTSYVKDPLPERVARLETKQFGKPCLNEDLCDRIDKLDKMANAANPKRAAQVAAREAESNGSGPDNGGGNNGRGGKGGSLGKTLLGLLGGAMGSGMLGNGLGMMPGAMMPSVQDDMRKSSAAKQQQQQQGSVPPKPSAPTNPFAAGAEPTTGAENRIAVIEKFVLGREHSELPLAERVQHVEKKLVPYEHHQAGQDLNVRVDHLWSILAAANKQSTKSVAAAQGSTQ